MHHVVSAPLYTGSYMCTVCYTIVPPYTILVINTFVLTNHNPLHNQKSDTVKSDMGARMLGARGRVVRNGIGEAEVFLLTHVPWAEHNGSVGVFFGGGGNTPSIT